MITDIFWSVATSTLALELLGVLLLAALVVGYFPLLKYLPVIGPYVPAARLAAVLVAILMCFLFGFRASEDRDNSKNLRATVEAQRADLENARKSATDATQRASEIEKAANDQRKADSDYIASLKPNPVCGFDPGPRRLRFGPSRRNLARSTAGAG